MYIITFKKLTKIERSVIRLLYDKHLERPETARLETTDELEINLQDAIKEGFLSIDPEWIVLTEKGIEAVRKERYSIRVYYKIN